MQETRFLLPVMSDLLLVHEGVVRVVTFGAIFAVMAAWEVMAPRRAHAVLRPLRWTNNLALTALNTMLIRVLVPSGVLGVALLADAGGWGLLRVLTVPPAAGVLVAVVALDLAIYLQHVVLHAVPGFWRFHRVHHADVEFDVTTATRFHPVEILLSAGVKVVAIAALGAPPVAVPLFEVLLNASAMFSHGNVRLPARIDAVLRRVLVTPDMHRVHHSAVRGERDRNFGFCLSCWDRVFGTYRAEPAAGHQGMTIGLERFRTARDQWLDRMLLQPFAGAMTTRPDAAIAPRRRAASRTA